MAFYLGIDGGGTKTVCAAGDESSVLATATAGPSNMVRVGEAQARESLHQCVLQACAAAGIAPAQVGSTCIGAAGAAGPETAAMVGRALEEVLPRPIEVVDDMRIALEAAFDGGPGVIVNAGTGSFAYGRDARGVTARAGGWGFAVSDEGSAQWIGRTAVTVALHARDPVVAGNHESVTESGASLLRALQEGWGTRSFEDFIRTANSTPPPDFSALFPAVLSSAEANDAAAQGVLVQAGAELALVAALVVRRLFPANLRPDRDPSAKAVVPLAMAGSVFRHAAQVREVFYNELRRQDPRVELNARIVNPVEGALRLARKGSQQGAAAKT